MIYTLSWRDNIEIARIAPAGSRLIAALDRACQVCQVHLTVSCATADHAPDDPHTTGDAYDVSVSTLTPAQLVRVHQFLTETLGPLFTVLYEVPRTSDTPQLQLIEYVNPHATGPHLHLQRAKGTTYPPRNEALKEVSHGV